MSQQYSTYFLASLLCAAAFLAGPVAAHDETTIIAEVLANAAPPVGEEGQYIIHCSEIGAEVRFDGVPRGRIETDPQAFGVASPVSRITVTAPGRTACEIETPLVPGPGEGMDLFINLGPRKSSYFFLNATPPAGVSPDPVFTDLADRKAAGEFGNGKGKAERDAERSRDSGSPQDAPGILDGILGFFGGLFG